MREPDEITGESGAGQPVEPLTEATSPHADVTAVRASWCAPLPPPNALARYNDVLPGAAERILQMAERQQEQDHNAQMEAIGIERTVVVSDARRAYLGLLAGFIIFLLVISGGIYLIASGYDWAGIVQLALTCLAWSASSCMAPKLAVMNAIATVKSLPNKSVPLGRQPCPLNGISSR